MRKLFLTLSLLIMCTLSYAQRYVFCEIVGTNTGFIGKSKVSVELDFGNEQSVFFNNMLVDENGKPIKFNSMVDAMNWMGESGWEFCQAYVIGSNGVYIYHWLLKLDTEYLTDEEKEEIFGKLQTKRAVRLSEKAEKQAMKKSTDTIVNIE